MCRIVFFIEVVGESMNSNIDTNTFFDPKMQLSFARNYNVEMYHTMRAMCRCTSYQNETITNGLSLPRLKHWHNFYKH